MLLTRRLFKVLSVGRLGVRGMCSGPIFARWGICSLKQIYFTSRSLNLQYKGMNDMTSHSYSQDNTPGNGLQGHERSALPVSPALTSNHSPSSSRPAARPSLPPAPHHRARMPRLLSPMLVPLFGILLPFLLTYLLLNRSPDLSSYSITFWGKAPLLFSSSCYKLSVNCVLCFRVDLFGKYAFVNVLPLITVSAPLNHQYRGDTHQCLLSVEILAPRPAPSTWAAVSENSGCRLSDPS